MRSALATSFDRIVREIRRAALLQPDECSEPGREQGIDPLWPANKQAIRGLYPTVALIVAALPKVAKSRLAGQSRWARRPQAADS